MNAGLETKQGDPEPNFILKSAGLGISLPGFVSHTHNLLAVGSMQVTISLALVFYKIWVCNSTVQDEN